MDETIVAIATPMGEAAIGIVRLSGSKAVEVADDVWLGPKLSQAKSHTVIIGQTKDENGIIDKSVACIMKAPRSYTGEDTVEFSCHGGPVILKRLLGACVKSGARIAEPGEFTKRAFLNGKMDLVQAEAVADIIASNSESALKSAQEHLQGTLSKNIMSIHDKLADLRSYVEATLDFSEDELNIDPNRFGLAIDDINKSIDALLSTYQNGRLIKDGLKIAIVGPPNAGKSSIFNMLLGCDRSIVHHSAGTTRDVIEGEITISGTRIILKDTAGLRISKDEVETIGVERAKSAISWADACIFVLDASSEITSDTALALKDALKTRTIICQNKCDLISSDAPIDSSAICRGLAGENVKAIKTSATTGKGKEELKAAIGSLLPHVQSYGATLTNVRHKELLENANEEITKARIAYSNQTMPDIIANHLNLAQHYMGEITGKVTSDDILNRIFSRFCIGK